MSLIRPRLCLVLAAPTSLFLLASGCGGGGDSATSAAGGSRGATTSSETSGSSSASGGSGGKGGSTEAAASSSSSAGGSGGSAATSSVSSSGSGAASSSSASSSSSAASSSSSSGGGGLCVPGTTTSCYSGPAGTLGKGICSAGMATCLSDGASFGPCVGEVLPALDNCATTADEDCDGVAAPCTGGGLWAKEWGGNYDQYATAVAADSAGNVLVTGMFSGTIDFGSGPVQCQGSPDFFLAKLGPTGATLWSKTYLALGTAGYITAVAADANDEVYITGYFYGPTDFGGTTLSAQGGGDIFLVKLDAAGNLKWAKSFGDASAQYPSAMAPRPGGGVVIVGSFQGSFSFGGNLLSNPTLAADVFVASFDGAGNHVFSARYGDGGTQNGGGVAVDAAGNVFVSATVYGTIKFGPTVLASAGGEDIAIAKLDSLGTHLWSKIIGNAGDQTIGSLAVDAAGNLFASGGSAGAVDFGNGTPAAPPALGGFYVLSLDPTGGFRWVKQYADGISPGSLRLATDLAGNALLAGGFAGTLDLGGGPLMTGTTSHYDVFALKLSPAGAHVWSKRFGDSTQLDDVQYAGAVAADPSGNVILAGYAAGVIDFGTGDLFANDPAMTGDAFVAKLAP